MGNLTAKGEVIRRYCEEFPNEAAMTLARRIYAAEGHRYTDINAVRQAVMYHRGKVKKNGKYSAAKPVPSNAPSTTVRTDYRTPATLAQDRSDFVIHGTQRILCLSDIHFPIHDAAALDAALKYGRENDPTIILLNGDTFDLHDFSFHEKTTLRSFVMAEVEMFVEFADALRAMFPKARIILKEGNHCDRLARYLLRKAPELAATDCFDLPGFIRFLSGRMDALERFEWVKDKRVIRAGHLSFLHGHEYKGGGGVNPARWLILRTKESAVCGHFHRTAEHSERSLNGRQVGTWSSGCLCHLSPDYLPYNDWNHGFVWADIYKDGDFRVKNIRIINGKVV